MLLLPEDLLTEMSFIWQRTATASWSTTTIDN